jgi:hypothetical protein
MGSERDRLRPRTSYRLSGDVVSYCVAIFGDLEARTLELPDRDRSRFREDSEIQDALSRIADLSKRFSEGDTADPSAELAAAETLWTEVSESWTRKLDQIELDAKISQPDTSCTVPCCGYCGADFTFNASSGPSATGASAASWARLRRHVEKLHPKEWKAALEAARVHPDKG